MEYAYGERDVLMHISSLLCIARADGVIRDEEKKYVIQVAASYAGLCAGKTFDEIVENSSPVAIAEVEAWQLELARHPKAARNLLKDLIGLGLADNEFCEQERQAVADIADKLNVPNGVVDELEAGLEMLLQATQRIQSLVEYGTPCPQPQGEDT